MLTRLIAAIFLAATPLATRAAVAQGRTDLLARGEYLTRAADCEACHTAPGGHPFAGGRPFVLPFGTIYSPNITPDQATGIADYSDADWLGALHQGKGRDGKHLYPAMPYASYTRMSDEDALAIKAYLMSLAPVSAKTPDGTVRFPFNIRWLMVFWNFFNNSDRRFEPDGSKSAEYNRGAYLVQALGHCGECHTPRNITMGLSSSRTLAGAEIEGWQAYNLTSDPVHGLGTWTDEQLAQYLSTGQAAGRGPASGPMAEAVEDSLRYLTREDIRAMVVYLRDVPPQADGPPVGQPGSPAVKLDPLGVRLFAQACAGCHLPDGGGRQVPWAALEGSHTVSDPDGTNLVQVLKQGTRLTTAEGEVFMHPFTGAYTDRELAALSNYVVGQFGFREGRIAPTRFPRSQASDMDAARRPAF